MSPLGAARAILARSMSLRPLIAICGTTGVGKSKLAIELALALAKERYGGYQGARIINADAMQVYAGIDILTNKVPAEEQCGVEHLLMGFRHPGEQYVVGQWVRDAMRAVCQIFPVNADQLSLTATRAVREADRGDARAAPDSHRRWGHVLLDSASHFSGKACYG